jgi:alpha-N-acetylglucosaminidase
MALSFEHGYVKDLSLASNCQVAESSTATFSYTTAFWTWQDWELELDWMALHGVNLPLAWVGVEKILLEIFQDLGMTDAEIMPFFSGPAFQAWNRMGNIQGSWGGDLPAEWIDSQFELQKNITARMVELGMTPVLPAFSGFVPRAITRALPGAMVVNGSSFVDGEFLLQYSNNTFMQPLDPNFIRLQKSFISKQREAYGDITHIYALDQFNKNTPVSGDLDYLRNVTSSTWISLKNADLDAVWMMQGRLFFENVDFWTEERIEAYLSGVENPKDMLILDVFSESSPQWQKTNGYFGKPWLWCQLHNIGGSNGLYGQIMNVTNNPIEALANSSSLVGFGLTMEGQEGNEIIYDLLLDQLVFFQCYITEFPKEQRVNYLFQEPLSRVLAPGTSALKMAPGLTTPCIYRLLTMLITLIELGLVRLWTPKHISIIGLPGDIQELAPFQMNFTLAGKQCAPRSSITQI